MVTQAKVTSGSRATMRAAWGLLDREGDRDRCKSVYHLVPFHSPQPSEQKVAPILFGMWMIVRPE